MIEEEFVITRQEKINWKNRFRTGHSIIPKVSHRHNNILVTLIPDDRKVCCGGGDHSSTEKTCIEKPKYIATWCGHYLCEKHRGDIPIGECQCKKCYTKRMEAK